MTQLEQIQRAVDHIEERLRDELSIEGIARAAGFSIWHFQKVFTGVVGDTVMNYVRERRLGSALRDLLGTERRILEIALEYRFESQESFTRAFKSKFGFNPGECRRQNITSGLSVTTPRITSEYLDHLYGRLTMQPKFVNLPEKKVIGMSTRFISVHSPDADNMVAIPALWKAFMPRKAEIPAKAPGHVIGACERVADPADRKHPDELSYTACIEVESFERVPPGMSARTLPAGRFAVFTHKGKLEGIEHTMRYIFGSWIPRSGEKLRDAPDLEMYDHRFKLGQDDSEVDLYIPIEESID